MVAGREVTPADHANTERLMRYWAEGEGAAKIRWGEAGDFDRCVTFGFVGFKYVVVSHFCYLVY